MTPFPPARIPEHAGISERLSFLFTTRDGKIVASHDEDFILLDRTAGTGATISTEEALRLALEAQFASVDLLVVILKQLEPCLKPKEPNLLLSAVLTAANKPSNKLGAEERRFLKAWPRSVVNRASRRDWQWLREGFDVGLLMGAKRLLGRHWSEKDFEAEDKSRIAKMNGRVRKERNLVWVEAAKVRQRLLDIGQRAGATSVWRKLPDRVTRGITFKSFRSHFYEQVSKSE